MGIFGSIGKIAKGIGKVATAPGRLALKGVQQIPGVKQVGGLASKLAPFVGLVPGLGTLAGGVLGAGGAALHGDSFGNVLKSGAMGAGGAALSGLAGGALGGLLKGKVSLGGLGSLSGLGKSLSGVFKNEDGSLDLEKIISLGGGAAKLIGQGQQRGENQRFAQGVFDANTGALAGSENLANQGAALNPAAIAAVQQAMQRRNTGFVGGQ